jgi:hypothetical protein
MQPAPTTDGTMLAPMTLRMPPESSVRRPLALAGCWSVRSRALVTGCAPVRLCDVRAVGV